MPSDTETIDPLLRAIAELRADVNHLINEQVAAVRERLEELVPPRALRAAPALNLNVNVNSNPNPNLNPNSNLTPSVTEPAQARPLDPRQRLDALAKHLDHRLRLANVPAPERVG